MEVATWAEIRRLHEVERLSQREIARRVGVHRRTVSRALALPAPPTARPSASQASILDPFKPRIDQLLAEYPDLSAVRICEEIRRGENGYRGSVILVRRYVRRRRPAPGRVYQEVHYSPGQAMQVDWGDCHSISIDGTQRKVSVFVAVLCYSRLLYLEFSLSQRKSAFYRAIVHALEFFGGAPRRIIFDNLKAAVLNGHGRHACLHPEFAALCGHYYLEPLACQRADPESKGIVEGGVRYVKRNALQGRADQLTGWQDYRALALSWRDTVANVRLHERTRRRPIDLFQEQEQSQLRPLPPMGWDTDEVVDACVTPHARVNYDGNRYSVPPDYCRKPVTIRASDLRVRVFQGGQLIAEHARHYGRRQVVCLPDHQLQARQLRTRTQARGVEQAFQALGPVARTFHLRLQERPVQTTSHLRRLLKLAQLYGKQEVVQAMAVALDLQTCDAAYVESILLQQRRQQELPSPTPLRPRRQELIDEIETDDPDPALYDRLFGMPGVDGAAPATPPKGPHDAQP